MYCIQLDLLKDGLVPKHGLMPVETMNHRQMELTKHGLIIPVEPVETMNYRQMELTKHGLIIPVETLYYIHLELSNYA